MSNRLTGGPDEFRFALCRHCRARCRPRRRSGPAQNDSPPPGPPADQAQPAPPDQYSSNEVVDAGHHFFGGISRGLASVVEKAVSQWGLPNGYILGEEASGAFIGGLRYGEGTLYTKNAGDLRVYWQGPSLGFDAGGDGARTMMLVYNLPRTAAIYRAVRRHRRLGLFRRRFRHDGADRRQHRGGADPLRASGCGSAPMSAI